MAKPLDFLHKNNNQDEWAKRYIGSKMGIEPTVIDATYTNAMDKISMQNQPSSQYSLYNQDRIDDENQQIIDTAIGSATPLKAIGKGLNLILRMKGNRNWWRHVPVRDKKPKFREEKLLTKEELEKISKQNTKIRNTAKAYVKSTLLEAVEKARIPFKYNKKPSYYENLNIDDLRDVLREHYRKSADIKNLPRNLRNILGMQTGGAVFNPESSGYDMQTALAAGLERDAETGHMGSLDPRTGMVLKGRQHESWNPMAQTEMSLGNTIKYDPDKGRYFSVQGGMYESAPADETAHDQMNNLIFENEMKQSQGASPLSFLNQDRIDSQNQELMDAVMSMSVPAAGAISLGKSAFGKLANFPKLKVLNQIPEMLETGKVNWNQFARKGLPKSAQKSFDNIKDLKWLEDLIKRNQ